LTLTRKIISKFPIFKYTSLLKMGSLRKENTPPPSHPLRAYN